MGSSAENLVEALVLRAPGIENNPDRPTDVAARGTGRPGSLGRLFVRSLILIACLFTVTVAVAAPPSQPNVVLILADDLGYGDVGAFGATDILTPNIDRLGSEGVMLSDYYVAPSCSISRVMLMTGSYAPRAGMSRNFTPSSTRGIHTDEVTLGDLAQSAGYATGIFGKWHLGDHYQFRPLRHGFDEFFGIPHSNDMWPFHPLMPVTAGEDPRLTAARARAELTGYAGQGSTFSTGEGFPNLPLYDGDTIVEFNSNQSIFGGGFIDRAVDFIERHSTERFFAYVPLTGPHVPLHPSAAFAGTSARDLYGDSVQEIDSGVGRILDKLVELGIDDETLVIFVSDNGPWLEYGIDAGSGMPYTGGKETQLEGGIRVPAVMRWPGQLTAGTVIDEPLSATDFLPTLAGLIGVPVPSDRTIDGVDIWPLLSGQVSSLSRQAIFGFDEADFSLVKLGAIRSGDWKLHVNTSGSSVTPVALFDLATDIAESTNVTSGNAGVVSSLTTLGEQIVADILANQRPIGQVALSGEPFVQSSGFGEMIAIEAEHFHSRQARSGHNWDVVTESHNSAGEAIRAQPNSGANINTDYVNTSPHLEYRIDVGTPGRYYVWVRAKGANIADDSVHLGIDGVAAPNGYRVSDFESHWTWSSTLMGTGARAFLDIPAGERVLDLWMREDGVIIDKIVLTSDAQFEPEGQGLVESQQGTLGPALQLSTSTLGYTADEGDTTPLSQVMSLTTSDSTAAPFSLSSSEPSWLTVSPPSGTTPAGTITVTANPNGLAAGQYTGTITATATGYVQDTVDVTLTVVGDSGVIAASVSSTPSNVNLTSEGSGDWAHWGLSSATSVNRKSGVTTQIGAITALGSAGRRFQGGGSRATYSWTDGTPTGSASTTAGLYFGGTGNGFEFNVPADTTAKTLTVHLGGYQARGQIEVSLSDGTVSPYVMTVEDLSNPFDRTLTINFQAASPGQTLTVRYSKLTGSNITLQAATLVGEVAPPQPSLELSTSTLGYTADEGDTTPLSQVMSLTTSDSTAAPFSLSSSEPSWLTVSPPSGTTPAGTITVTANPNGLAAGQYTGTITATATGYVQDTVDVTLTVVGDSGVIAASVSSTPSNVNLTSEGSGDWAHWGLSSATSVNRKSGVTTQIGAITALGSAGRRFQGGGSRATYSWTDGTPTGSASTTAGLYFGGTGNGFEFNVPADTTAKTLTVHLGGYQARGQIEVSLSDGTVSPYVMTVEDLSNPFDRTLTINFQAASPGQTLTVRYSKLTGSNITLQAATLVGEVAPPQPSLELSTSTLGYTADEGDTTPLSQVMSLTTSDSTAAPFSLSSSEPSWLTVSPPSGTTPAGTITVTASPNGLAAGQYTGTITATATGYVQDTVDVTLTVVGDSGVIAASVSSTPSNVNLTSEGSGDWAHWGLSSATSVNRKSGVTTQIGAITALGSAGRRFQGGSARASYSWTDGTPTGSASTTAGLYFGGTGNGFEFNVPADTTAKTLTVHLGGYQARGQIEVSLSDGTVSPYVMTVEDLSNPFDRTLTINFQAASPGQTLTVRYSKLTGSNITLQAATLVGEVAPPQPSLELSTSTLGYTADEGDTAPLSQVMSLTTSDSTAAPFSLSSSEPSWLTVSPPSGTTPAGTITVTANPNGLVAGQYTGTITATATGYVQDTVDVTLTVVGDSGVIAASVSSTPSNVNLTSEGSGDWAHWGLSSATSVNRKSGVTTQIGAITALGSAGRRFQGGSARASYSWTDGTPTGSASTTAGLYFGGTGNGFEFNVPADTTAKTLTVHLGGYQARGQIEVSLSDGTVSPYVMTVEDLSNPFDRTLTINFQAASPGQTLTVRYSKLTGSNITLQAATLVGEVAPLALPYSDNFDDGDSDGWAFVNETPLADAWSAGGGSLMQANAIESVASFEESYHLGSYAWLPAGASLTDYRVSARLERTGTGRAESFGILFRYRDVDNFYRFTLNTRYGFGRLEKREGGVYFTLAVSAFGDDPESPFTLGIDVDGQDIRVSVDGSPVMAATDGAHASGSVGLFTQSPSKFDDVVIDPIVASPDVKLVSPAAMTVVPGSQVDVAAVVRNLPPGGAVEFSMNGQPPVTLATPPWTTTFSSVPAGPARVTARVLDSGNNPVDSHNVDFAIGGDYIIAIGDSITNGIGDTYAADNDDALRVFSNTAYASVLASRLEAMPPTEVIVYNEGIGGDDAAAADLLRLQSIIERHPSGSAALVQLGTNDANADRTAAAFESDMQSIVDRLVAESMTVYVATLPPILGGSNPLSSDANQSIVLYNDEITQNLAGAMPGADLWAYFAPDDTGDDIADRVREDLFADDLHPNALGHAIIADLWYNVLLGDSTGTTIVPFAVDALLRTNYKQNLLEPGDAYLIDSAATLTDVPTVLASAIWIMPAQADAGSTATSFLEFDLDRSATVYVAYDADAGSLPEWLDPATSGFVDTGQQLTTTQTNYRIFSAPFGAGNVSLGGNHAIGGGDAADMYLVGLLPGT